MCPDDPRTKDQRRADALAALAAGLTELRCECDAEGLHRNRSAHRLAGGDSCAGRTIHRRGHRRHGPGYMPGHGPLPAATVQELAGEAKLKPLVIPSGTAPPEPGYRPSVGLAEFVRARDLTCRFPGCEQPAQFCDLDHTIPYPVGPTHPSNIKCLCRFHHLLKTFWTGVGGWSDRQSPDGTFSWTAPSGRVYTTKPGGALFFPILATPTGELKAEKRTATRGATRGDDAPTETNPKTRARRAHRHRTPSTNNSSNANNGCSPNSKSADKPAQTTNRRPSRASRLVA